MIKGPDLHRVLVEYNQCYSSPEEWLVRANIEEDAFIEICDQFAFAMMAFARQNGMERIVESCATTIAAAMAVGVEIGRQYPATPFE